MSIFPSHWENQVFNNIEWFELLNLMNTYPILLFELEWTLSLAYTEVYSLSITILALFWVLNIHIELITGIQNVVHGVVVRAHTLRITFEWQWHWNTVLVHWVRVIMVWNRFQVHNFRFSTEELVIELCLLVLIDIHNWSGWHWSVRLRLSIKLHIQFHWLFKVFLILYLWFVFINLHWWEWNKEWLVLVDALIVLNLTCGINGWWSCNVCHHYWSLLHVVRWWFVLWLHLPTYTSKSIKGQFRLKMLRCCFEWGRCSLLIWIIVFVCLLHLNH